MSVETILGILSAMREVPAGALVHDALVCLHLLAMAVGLGSVAVAEIGLVAGIAQPLRGARVAALWRTHRIVLAALAALWLTGGALAALATGLDPAEASPKLLAKLATVTGLGLTALAMGGVALPLIARHAGARPADLGLGAKLLLGLLAGLSSGGWLSALMLGAAGALREAPAQVLAVAVGGMHLGAVTLALAGALALHLVLPGTLRRPAPVRLT